MFFNKSALITIATIVAAVGNAAAQNPSFTGVACHFDRDHLPADFTPCGGNCPPPSPDTLPIALPSTLFNGADSCCSTFTITYQGKTVRGTYAYKSSSRANTQNLALDDELFAQLADPNTVDCISPVTYHL
ncbi:hypothetical protein K435DRAFT_863421 [Dendrothele bispora CBS 962.96]|uniref:Uncharacterized protein n=1 Tax=Dendrothele bispora (strain CBS 962.96) TaxID=1314807 RepID=A0A4S8LPU8_DENBC|nr:hypothetical protein K435DRAFT_863421 [Dendrothele bispora CBS 962.96]